MARLGCLRVKDVLEYERDIRGKRLIRLRAGVGSGKNYWARHLLESNPDLQILIITSRKNTAEAEAIKLDTNCKIGISKLIDIQDKEWYEDFPGNTIVCTYAYIAHFFENIYSLDQPSTHLWNKFDLIIVDEVHSLTLDASFADSPFYVERFIQHALRLNSRCDVVAMSGTPAPVDWLFTEDHWGTQFVDIDLYDQCIHLVPNKVFLMTAEVVADRVHDLWAKGRRLIYFVNSVKRMASLITELESRGVREEDIGIAFSNSENTDKLPLALLNAKKELRKYLVAHSALPDHVKIFITTTQNKEGISILNDDIKYMFAESQCKAELEQMAGRVRGNPQTGTGLYALIVVHNAPNTVMKSSYVVKELDRLLVDQAKEVIDKHQALMNADNQEYCLSTDIKTIQKNYMYLRYDYIGRCFAFYVAREKCFHHIQTDQHEFSFLLDQFNEHLHYELVPGGMLSVTGGYELNREWFPFSMLYRSPGATITPKEKATSELLAYLHDNDYINVPLSETQQSAIQSKILEIIKKYGKNALGFDRNLPKTLGPALKRFGLHAMPTKNHANNEKIIKDTK